MSGEGITMTTTADDWSRADAMTDDEVRAAALKDPDAQPLTKARLARVRPVPRTRTMRRALGLTQEAFAARFHIPARYVAGLGAG
jgi:putative transcriptional regulator